MTVVLDRGPALAGERSLDTSWMDQARCADSELDFVPTHGFSGYAADLAELREVCADCPVKRECLEYAFEQRTSLVDGFYAGTVGAQRKRVKDIPGRVELLLVAVWD